MAETRPSAAETEPVSAVEPMGKLLNGCKDGASLLQVSTESHVLLFDFVALYNNSTGIDISVDVPSEPSLPLPLLQASATSSPVVAVAEVVAASLATVSAEDESDSQSLRGRARALLTDLFCSSETTKVLRCIGWVGG